MSEADRTGTSAAPQDDVLAQVRSTPGALVERMGIEILEASDAGVVARMPVEGNTQPYGLLHGGASVVLAETVGSIAAALAAGPGRTAVGLEISSSHHRGVRSGHVTARTRTLAAGRTVATFGIEIVDDEGRLVNTSRLTCVLRDAPTQAD